MSTYLFGVTRKAHPNIAAFNERLAQVLPGATARFDSASGTPGATRHVSGNIVVTRGDTTTYAEFPPDQKKLIQAAYLAAQLQTLWQRLAADERRHADFDNFAADPLVQATVQHTITEPVCIMH